MGNRAEKNSDAAKSLDYSLVGTWVELFKGPCERGTVSLSITYRALTRWFVTITCTSRGSIQLQQDAFAV